MKRRVQLVKGIGQRKAQRWHEAQACGNMGGRVRAGGAWIQQGQGAGKVGQTQCSGAGVAKGCQEGQASRPCTSRGGGGGTFAGPEHSAGGLLFCPPAVLRGVVCFVYADATDVQQVLKTVQEQGQQLQALERQVAVLQFTSTITDKVLRYNEDNITRGSNVDFKLSLQQAYGYVYSSSGVLLTCMLSGERLPSQLVIAGHIVKHSWKDIGIHAQMGIGADDVGNGLLLFKPFEWAFDNSKLCFIYNQRFDQFDMHILDPALRARPVLEMFDAPHGFSQLVQSYVQRISKEHLAMARTTFKDKTFQDFEAHSLKLPASPRPYKRALCFHAHRVRVFALESHWVEDDWKFDDFWSEGCPTDINDWLEMQLQQVQPGQ